jgi:hypothetical protein
MEIACRRGHHSELNAEWKNMKIFEGLSNIKNMVFNVKKLLNIGLGLALWRKEPMRAEWAADLADLRHRRPVSRRQTCKRRHLSRAFETACGPLGPEGRSLMENSPFGGFSAGLRRLNQLAAVGGILDLGGLATHICQTWICWTFQPAASCGQKVRLRLTLILRPYVRLSLRNGTGKRRSRSTKHTALSAAAIQPSLRKMKLKLNGG